MFIFRTIFQPWALSSDVPAAERVLFTTETADRERHHFSFGRRRRDCDAQITNNERSGIDMKTLDAKGALQ